MPGAVYDTDRVRVERDGTGTLWVEHKAPPSGADPWDLESVAGEFAQALLLRRKIQGQQILRRFGPLLRAGKVLDYGCGHGTFLCQLLDAGIDATGADIGVPDEALVIPEGRFTRLTEPWSLPQGGPWTTVTLLDVLEHHPEPAAFVRSFEVDQFVVKVPIVNGPIGRAANLAARLGKPQLLETLLLVDDVSPHVAFYTARGLDAVMADAGYERIGTLRHADVGKELPLRIRGGLKVEGRAARLVLTAAGAGLAAIAPVWTDTATFAYRRREGGPLPR